MSENLNNITNWWHTQTKIQKASLKLFGAGLAALVFQIYPPQPPPIHIAIIGVVTLSTLGLYSISKRWPKAMAIIICGLPLLLTWYYYYANAMLHDNNGTLSMVGAMIIIMSVIGDLISSQLIVWTATLNIIIIAISKSLAGEFENLPNIVLDHQMDFVLVIVFARNFILKHKKTEEAHKAQALAEDKARLAEEKAEIEREKAEAEKLKRKAIEAWTDAVDKFQKSENARQEASRLLHSNRITLEEGTVASDVVEKRQGLKLTISAIDPETKEDCKYPILIPHKIINQMNGNLKLDQGHGLKLTGRVTSEPHPRFKTQIYIKVLKIENIKL